MVENINREGIFLRNSFYSLLSSLSSIILILLLSYIKAKIITPEEWGFLILATSYITLISIIANFLPPGLGLSIFYYMPRFLALNQKNKLKSYIKNIIYLRLIVIISFYVILTILFYPLINLLEFTLNNYVNLFFLLSPIFIVNSLNPILNGINHSFNLFKKTFLLIVFQYSLNIIPLLLLFLYSFENISLEMVALLNLISVLIPFFINSVHIFHKISNLKTVNSESNYTFKSAILEAVKYGAIMKTHSSVQQVWNEIKIISIGYFTIPEMVTGYQLSYNFSQFSFTIPQSFYQPALLAYSDSKAQNDLKSTRIIFNLTIKISLFLTLLVTGIFFLSLDFFLFFIFGVEYSGFSIFLKIMLVTIIFSVITPSFNGIIISNNKRKLLFFKILLYLICHVPLFFIGLLLFGVTGSLLGLFIGRFIMLLAEIILSPKFFDIRIEIKSFLFQYFSFFISLFLVIIINEIFLSKITRMIFTFFNLQLFIGLDIFSIILFIAVFLFLNFQLRIISFVDIKYIESIIDSKKFINRIIMKLVNLIKFKPRNE